MSVFTPLMRGCSWTILQLLKRGKRHHERKLITKSKCPIFWEAFQGKPEIRVHFLGFVNVEVTTWSNLSAVILDKLNELMDPFEDCRGKAYDNVVGMKGKYRARSQTAEAKNIKWLTFPGGPREQPFSRLLLRASRWRGPTLMLAIQCKWHELSINRT